jgi:hypothetical protein
MENHEKWLDLCALAAKEQDPKKLLALTQEIARLLEEKTAIERHFPDCRIFGLSPFKASRILPNRARTQ